jgi:hypothetical protein
MKTKYIFLTILCIIISPTIEAQLLKKLTKKAEQAAERTILKKTDEVVTETTEKTIDGVTNGSENNTETQNTTNKTDPSNQTHQASPGLNPMASANTKTNLPEHYDFDWEYKTELKTSEKDSMDMNFLIGSSNKDYFGMVISNEEIKKQGGTITMVTDSKAKISIMFMDVSGQKMAQTTTIKEPKANKNEAQYSMKEIGSKTILGYESYGMEVENADYIATIYFTLDAPVNFSAFFAFSNNKNAPKGFDPALLQVLKEDALIMEMTAVNKKKSKESFTMTAISLEQKETTIKTKYYQVMNMGF